MPGSKPMQKGNSYFDVQTGKMIHKDLTKGKKMNDTVENGQTASEKRTDKKVRIGFYDEKGAVHKHPVAGCKKIRADFIEAGGEDILNLEDLTSDMIYRLAAFGASVLGRNEVNTTKEDEGPDAAKENLLARWQGFRNDSYRSLSTGVATPLILLALERALTLAGKAEDAVNAKVAEYRAKYDAGEDEKAIRKNRNQIGKDLRSVPEIRAAEKAIKEEREAARAANAKQGSLAEI